MHWIWILSIILSATAQQQEESSENVDSDSNNSDQANFRSENKITYVKHPVLINGHTTVDVHFSVTNNTIIATFDRYRVEFYFHFCDTYNLKGYDKKTNGHIFTIQFMSKGSECVAEYNSLTPSTQYFAKISHLHGLETFRLHFWTDFNIGNFKLTKTVINEVDTNQEYLQQKLYLTWNTQYSDFNPQVTKDYNPRETYSIFGISPDQNTGTTGEIFHIHNLYSSGLEMTWPRLENNTLPYTYSYDLTDHPKIFVFLIKDRDADRFRNQLPEIYTHIQKDSDAVTDLNLNYADSFCKTNKVLECQSIYVENKPSYYKYWNIKEALQLTYLQNTTASTTGTTGHSGYIINTCQDLETCKLNSAKFICQEYPISEAELTSYYESQELFKIYPVGTPNQKTWNDAWPLSIYVTEIDSPFYCYFWVTSQDRTNSQNQETTQLEQLIITRFIPSNSVSFPKVSEYSVLFPKSAELIPRPANLPDKGHDCKNAKYISRNLQIKINHPWIRFHNIIPFRINIAYERLDLFNGTSITFEAHVAHTV